MPATPEDIELTRRYQAQLRQLGGRAGAALADMWDQLDTYNAAAHAAWQAQAAPVVASSQGQASGLAAAYVATLAAAPMPSVDVAAGPDLLDPFIAFGGAINRGLTFESARDLGRSRAEAVGSESVQWTARQAVGEAASATRGVVGWRRVLEGDSCEWCALASTQRYSSAEAASLGNQHARCDCDVVPIIGDRDPGQVINAPVLDRLQEIPRDQRTGYVTADGAPAPRPEAVPQEQQTEEA